MGKKVVLAVFGGIALLGLVMSIVGWAMGGQVGSLRVEEGEMVYSTAEKNVQVGTAPSWWGNGDYMVMNWDWRNNIWDAIKEKEYTDDVMDEYHEAAEAAGDMDWITSGEDVQVNEPEKVVNLPFSAAELASLELNIEAGYLVVQQGEEPGLTVRGPLAFSSDFDGGIWTVEASVDQNIKTRKGEDGLTHFFYGNRDITTVFLLTLPQDMPIVEARMDLGTMTLQETKADIMSLYSAVGAIQVQGGQVENFSLKTEVGAAKVEGLQTGICQLSTEVGAIEFLGGVVDSIDVSCSVGAVDVQLTEPSLDGGFEADCTADLGSITVDGQTALPMTDTTLTAGDKTLIMTLNCEVGSISVKPVRQTEVVAAIEQEMANQ